MVYTVFLLLFIYIMLCLPAIITFILLVGLHGRWRKIGWLLIFLIATVGYNAFYGEYFDDNIAMPPFGRFQFVATMTLAIAAVFLVNFRHRASTTLANAPQQDDLQPARSVFGIYARAVYGLILIAFLAFYYGLIGHQVIEMAYLIVRIPLERLYQGFMVVAYIVLLLLPVVVATVIRSARRRTVEASLRAGEAQAPSSGKTPLPDMLFFAALGLVAPTYALYYGFFSRIPGHVMFTAMVAVIAVCLLLVVIMSIGNRFSSHARGKIFLSSLAIATSTLAAYGWHSGQTLHDQARLIADGRPFCIESGDKNLTAPEDMTILNMRNLRTPVSLDVSGHALLTVRAGSGVLFYQWSYLQGAFFPSDIESSMCKRSWESQIIQP